MNKSYKIKPIVKPQKQLKPIQNNTSFFLQNAHKTRNAFPHSVPK